MPDSPKTNIGFENQNVQNSTPLMGVSHVLARTTKGNFNDPSQVIRNLSQFKNIYGSEIVPDGSISNIEKALAGGSLLRICSVPGSGINKALAISAIYNEEGVLTTDSGEVVTGEIGDSFKIAIVLGDSKLTAPVNKTELIMDIAIRTKEYIEYPNKLFRVILNPNGYLVANLYSNVFRYDDANAANLVESIPLMLMAGATAEGVYTITQSDLSPLGNLLNNKTSNNIEFVLKSAEYVTTVGTDVVHHSLTSVPSLLNYIDTNKNKVNGGSILVMYGDEATMGPITTDGLIYLFEGGSRGIAPTDEDWIASLEPLKDYTDAYQLTCSHLHQHLIEADAKLVHAAMAEFVKSAEEVVYYIDIPKYNTSGTPMLYTEMVAWVKDMITTIGYSKFIAYFGGGWKYYNASGVLKDCDNIGTVLGLGDASASNFGPWYHFSGSNRGLVENSVGPVSPNYGSPTNYPKINELAKNYINISVIKDVHNLGKRTMLYHNFSSQLVDNSEKFLGIVRLNLYLKKTLRPILDSYIEEPNTFSTWNKIYYKVKPVMEKLVGSALTEWAWYGDQFVTSYKNLEINNEADVRLGKYKAKLTYKDIVAMQDIELMVSIDKSAGTVTVTQTTL